MKRHIAGFLSALMLFSSVFTGNVTFVHAADADDAYVEEAVNTEDTTVEDTLVDVDDAQDVLADIVDTQAVLVDDANNDIDTAAGEDTESSEIIVSGNENQGMEDVENRDFVINYLSGFNNIAATHIECWSYGDDSEDSKVIWDVWEDDFLNWDADEINCQFSLLRNIGVMGVGSEEWQATVDKLNNVDQVTYQLTLADGISDWKEVIKGVSFIADGAVYSLSEEEIDVLFGTGKTFGLNSDCRCYELRLEDEENNGDDIPQSWNMNILLQDGLDGLDYFYYVTYVKDETGNAVADYSNVIKIYGDDSNWKENSGADENGESWTNWSYTIELDEGVEGIGMNILCKDGYHFDSVRGAIVRWQNGDCIKESDEYEDPAFGYRMPEDSSYFTFFPGSGNTEGEIEFGILEGNPENDNKQFDISVWDGLENIEGIYYKIDNEEMVSVTIGDFEQRFPDDYNPESGEEPEWTNWCYHIEGNINGAEKITFYIRPKEGYTFDAAAGNRIQAWSNYGQNFDYMLDEVDLNKLATTGYEYILHEEGVFFDFGIGVYEKQHTFSINVNGAYNQLDRVEIYDNAELENPTVYGPNDFVALENRDEHGEVIDVQHKLYLDYNSEDFEEEIKTLRIRIFTKDGYNICYAEVRNLEADGNDALYESDRNALNGYEEYAYLFELPQSTHFELSVDIAPTNRYRFVDKNGNPLVTNNGIGGMDHGNMLSFSGVQKFYLQEIDEAADTLSWVPVTSDGINVEISRIGEEGHDSEYGWVVDRYHFATDTFLYSTEDAPYLKDANDEESLNDRIYAQGEISEEDMMLTEGEFTEESAITLGKDEVGYFVQIDWSKTGVYEEGGAVDGQAYMTVKVWDANNYWFNDANEKEYFNEFNNFHFVNTDFYLSNGWEEQSRYLLPNNNVISVEPGNHYIIANGVFDYQIWNGNENAVITDVTVKNNAPAVADVLYDVGEGEVLGAITVVPKKTGTATLIISYTFDGNHYFYVVKLNVKNDKAPGIGYCDAEGNWHDIIAGSTVEIPAGSSLEVLFNQYPQLLSDARVSVANNKIFDCWGQLAGTSIWRDSWSNELGRTFVTHRSDTYIDPIVICDIQPDVMGVAQEGSSKVTVNYTYNGKSSSVGFTVKTYAPEGIHLREVYASYNGGIVASPYEAPSIDIDWGYLKQFALFEGNEEYENTSKVQYKIVAVTEEAEENSELFKVEYPNAGPSFVVCPNYEKLDTWNPEARYYLVAVIEENENDFVELLRLPIQFTDGDGYMTIAEITEEPTGLYFDSNYQYAVRSVNVGIGKNEIVQNANLYSYVPYDEGLKENGVVDYSQFEECLSLQEPVEMFVMDDVHIYLKSVREDVKDGVLLGYHVQYQIAYKGGFGSNYNLPINLRDNCGFGPYPFVLNVEIIRDGKTKHDNTSLLGKVTRWYEERWDRQIDVCVDDYYVLLKRNKDEAGQECLEAYLISYIGHDEEIWTPDTIQIPMCYGAHGKQTGDFILTSVPVVGIAKNAFYTDVNFDVDQPRIVHLADSYRYYGISVWNTDYENCDGRLIGNNEGTTTFDIYSPKLCETSGVLYQTETDGLLLVRTDESDSVTTESIRFLDDGNAVDYPAWDYVTADTNYNWEIRSLEDWELLYSGVADPYNGEKDAIVLYDECKALAEAGPLVRIQSMTREVDDEEKTFILGITPFVISDHWHNVTFNINGGEFGEVTDIRPLFDFIDGEGILTGEVSGTFKELETSEITLPYLTGEIYDMMPYEFVNKREGGYPNIEVVRRRGYTFEGWYTAPTGGTKITGSTKFTATNDNTILYAHWKANTYTIKYDRNEPEDCSWTMTGSMTNQAMTYGTAAALKANAFKIEGYEFVGWSDNAEYDETNEENWGRLYHNGEVVNNLASKTGDVITMHAIWKPAEYRIIYHTFGYTLLDPEGIADQVYGYNDPAPLLGVIENSLYIYSFEGWYTDTTFKTKVSPEIIMTHDIDVYAKVVMKPLTIRFHSNWPEGTGAGEVVKEQIISMGTEQALMANSFKVVGGAFGFKGWTDNVYYYESSNFSAYFFTDKESANWTNYARNDGYGNFSLDLYAVWDTTFEYTLCSNVSTDCQSPIGLSEVYEVNTSGGNYEYTATYTYGKAVTLPVISRVGYDFVGWYDQNGKKVTQITKTTAGAQVYTAKWTPWTVTVKFDGNGKNGGSVQNIVCDSIDYRLIAKNGYTKNGYQLIGWSTTKMTLEQMGELTEDSDQYIPIDDLYLYIDTTGEKSELILARITEEGVINEGVVTELTKNKQVVTLYAVWAPKEYTITLYAPGADMSADTAGFEQLMPTEYYMSYMGVTTGVITLPTPTRAGYTFNGWINVDTGKKMTTIQKGTYGDIDLYASWKGTYTINFDINLPEGASRSSTNKDMPSQTMTLGANTALFKNTYAVEGYSFLGWTDQPDADNVYFLNSSKDLKYYGLEDLESLDYTIGDNGRYTITLYAVWGNRGYIYLDDTAQLLETTVAGLEYEMYDDGTYSPYYVAEYVYGTEYAKLPTPVRPGYTFNGWVDDNGKKVTKITRTMVGDITLHPTWKGNKYIVEFNANAPEGTTVTGKMTNQSYVYGTYKVLPKVGYKLNGYTLIGWNSNIDDAKAGIIEYGAVGYNMIQYEGIEDNKLTLYAVWEKNYYMITLMNVSEAQFEGDGPNAWVGDYYTITYTVDDISTNLTELLPEIYRTGYTFAGWCTDAKCSKKFAPKAGTLGSYTLYAKWVLNK